MLTTNKIQTGFFDVLWNGEKTEYQIINGSAGLSGADTPNIYGIINLETGKRRWIGTLQACKKVITHTIEKRSKT